MEINLKESCNYQWARSLCTELTQYNTQNIASKHRIQKHPYIIFEDEMKVHSYDFANNYNLGILLIIIIIAEALLFMTSSAIDCKHFLTHQK